ncbi:MAG: hypothetical protein N2B06_17215 [Clostridium sp.]
MNKDNKAIIIYYLIMGSLLILGILNCLFQSLYVMIEKDERELKDEISIEKRNVKYYKTLYRELEFSQRIPAYSMNDLPAYATFLDV